MPDRRGHRSPVVPVVGGEVRERGQQELRDRHLGSHDAILPSIRLASQQPANTTMTTIR